MEYPVYETNTRRFERILIGQFDVDLPHTTRKRCFVVEFSLGIYMDMQPALTFGWTIETHVELLHTIIDEGDLVIRHQPGENG